jgi:hypothetical protein
MPTPEERAEDLRAKRLANDKTEQEIALLKQTEKGTEAERIRVARQLHEQKRAEAQLATAKANTERAKLHGPFWQRPGVMAGLVAILGACAPLAAGVSGWFHHRTELAQKQNQIELEQIKQREGIRVAYLEKASAPAARGAVLRFLVSTSEDTSVVRWAKTEIERDNEDLGKKIDEAVQTKSRRACCVDKGGGGRQDGGRETKSAKGDRGQAARG